MHPWLMEWGEEVPQDDLKIPMALAFIENASRFASHLITWKGARRRSDIGCELVVFDLLTDSPQRPHADIRRTEPVGILFGTANDMPLILALREDFPDTEHQQLVPDGVPCALCVDDRPWIEAQVTWTPIELLERIGLWFHRAARGELHDPHQPLDPFFGVSKYNFIFPRSVMDGSESAELAFFATAKDPNTFLSIPFDLVDERQSKGVPRFVTLAYRVTPERMKRLRNAPSTLGSLARALEERGVDLVIDIQSRMKEWYGAQAKDRGRLSAPLAIIVEFPIISPNGQLTDALDTRAFVPNCTLGELGVAAGALFPATQDQGSQSGYAPALTPSKVQASQLNAIAIDVANVHIEFDQERAAELAGLAEADRRKVTLVGAGAIGSQVAMILAREGRFTWTVVDDDRLLPHNLARHTLEFRDLGKPKAGALSAQINGLRPPGSETPAKFLECNVLRPEQHQEALAEILKSSDIIIDASASVAAERFLSDFDSSARRAGTFFNPSGESVVVLTEPEDRAVTLRDLEAQYYRAVLREPALERHLSGTGERFAYTGACRALTNRIPQSRAALLSSLAADALGKALSAVSGAISIWTLVDGDGVTTVQPRVSAVIRATLLDWTVTIDSELKSAILKMRAAKLPPETGGILLGTADAKARTVHIVEALPSPPDSKEETVGYERGMAGVEQSIRNAMARTMDQVRYIGEWHSHPKNSFVLPSSIDLTQMVWLAGVLEMEDRPAVMLIAGDDEVNIISGEIWSSA